MTRYVVLGAGAVGASLGGRLFEAGLKAALVARGPHGAAMARDGLELAEPQRTRRVPVPVVLDPKELALGPNDRVLLAVKSQDTEAALAGLGLPRDVPVVCLQNGIRNEDCAREYVDQVIGAMVWTPATLLVPGRVQVHATPPGLILLGGWPEGDDPLADQVAADFRKAGFDSEALPDVRRYKYTKLLTNLAGPAEAVCGPEGVSPGLVARLREEGEAVLRAAGIDFVPVPQLLARASKVRMASIDGELRRGGSTWQSVARGAGSVETAYLTGEIVSLGRRWGVDVTVNARVLEASTRTGRVTAEALLSGVG